MTDRLIIRAAYDERRLVEINAERRAAGLPEWKDMEDFKKNYVLPIYRK